MQVQRKHWIQCLFLSMVPVWKEICCALFFSTIGFIRGQCKLFNATNLTKPSKATNVVACFLCAKAQKEQKMNSEC